MIFSLRQSKNNIMKHNIENGILQQLADTHLEKKTIDLMITDFLFTFKAPT